MFTKTFHWKLLHHLPKRILILISIFVCLSLFLSKISQSQPCLPDGIIFTSQGEIDVFQSYYPNCTEIEGDVLISGEYISNLLGLDCIESIGGTLEISGNGLPNLTGLENLQSVGDSLLIMENPDLINLQGLSSLESIGSFFLVYNNWNLTSLASLDNLQNVQGTIFLGLNDNLVSTSGLDSLEYVGGDLVLFLNDNLTNILGFQSLKSIGGALSIDGNEYLLNLQGLDSLTSIGGDLKLDGNQRLNDISSLMQLKAIGGTLLFHHNTNILSLNGLDSINPETIENLAIYWNYDLQHCHVKSICDYLNNPNGSVWFDVNADGCDNVTQVLEACGIVGVPDYQPVQQVSISPNPFTTSTNIEYELTEPSCVQITIYNTLGEVVLLVDEGTLPPGKHSFTWTPQGLPNGLYIVEVVWDGYRVRERLIVQ